MCRVDRLVQQRYFGANRYRVGAVPCRAAAYKDPQSHSFAIHALAQLVFMVVSFTIDGMLTSWPAAAGCRAARLQIHTRWRQVMRIHWD